MTNIESIELFLPMPKFSIGSDEDLYVAGGGYEFNKNDAAFQDRLYINDGKGNFEKKQNALPRLLTSKHCVKAADIDGDHDIDLFVGGRVVPGTYPTSPDSYILINDGKGVFKDSTSTVCAAIQKVGMVTDAVFTFISSALLSLIPAIILCDFPVLIF